jgi:hypothetical protein
MFFITSLAFQNVSKTIQRQSLLVLVLYLTPFATSASGCFYQSNSVGYLAMKAGIIGGIGGAIYTLNKKCSLSTPFNHMEITEKLTSLHGTVNMTYYDAIATAHATQNHGPPDCPDTILSLMEERTKNHAKTNPLYFYNTL